MLIIVNLIFFRSTDINQLCDELIAKFSILTPSIRNHLLEALEKIKTANFNNFDGYERHRTLKTHLLPLTNIAFDKTGEKFV